MDADTYKAAALARAEALKRCHFWPPEPAVRPGAWLSNFESSEQVTASVLLNHLLFYSDRTIHPLLLATYRNLRDDVRLGLLPGVLSLDDAIFTRVEGEEPNPADSGNLFCRKARGILEISEARVCDPEKALTTLCTSRVPLVFLDDFLGSGDQLIKTWTRQYARTSPRSFSEAQAAAPFPVFYITLAGTKDGVARVTRECPSIHVYAGHVLGPEYSVAAIAAQPHNQQVPDLDRNIQALLAKYAPSLQLPAYMKQSDFSRMGYHSFGLLLAFQHGCPDASIPLIWAKGLPADACLVPRS